MYIKEVSLQGFRNLEPLHIAPTAITLRGKPIFWNPFIFVPWDVLSVAEVSSSSLPLGMKKVISVWKGCGKTGVTASTSI